MKDLIIRQADSSEVQGFIQWGLDEGWNMPLKDPPTYFVTYPEGWLIAEVRISEIAYQAHKDYPVETNALSRLEVWL